MSYIGNTPGVSSQRVVLEEVVTGSPKSTFVPQSGYIIGYVDVLVNGLEIDSSDFTAPDGVNINLVTAAGVGDTVKVKTWLPRGLSDGYLKTEADARFLNLAGGQLTGPVGLGQALSAWGSGINPLQLKGGSLYSSATGNMVMGQNFYSDGVNSKYLTNNPATYYAQSGGVHQFAYAAAGTPGANISWLEAGRFDNSGNLQITNGNLVLASGKGIDFSANGNAGGMTGELLDDYERGTWSPVPTVNYGTGSITGHSSQGTYIKIGNLVHVKFQIYGITWSGSPINMGVNGLPFTVNASSENYSSGIAQNLSTGHMYQLEMGAGASYVSVIRKYDNGTAFTNQSVGFAGSATYFIA
jgi:hypothetical protein